MEIKTRKLFKELVKKLTMELLDEESIEEITTTGDVAGYSTPFAFSSKEDEKKKRYEKNHKMTEICQKVTKMSKKLPKTS